MRVALTITAVLFAVSGYIPNLVQTQQVYVRPKVVGTVNSQQMWSQMGQPVQPGQQTVQVTLVQQGPPQYVPYSPTPTRFPTQPVQNPQFPPQPAPYFPPQPAPAPFPAPAHPPAAGGHSHFGYDAHSGPETWPAQFPQCAGRAQSPIDINQAHVQMVNLPDMRYMNYWTPPQRMVLANNGHTLEVSGTWPAGLTPSITGSALQQDTYEFKQMHIHWGRTDMEGSEHTVNGKRFPMELHVVHFNKKYGTFENALKNKDGLAVLGFLFEVTNEPNPMIGQFIKYLGGVHGSQSRTVEIQPMPINILDLDRFQNDYVTYQGSLTTPPCAEVVSWFVSVRALTLSREQMQMLRSTVKEANHQDMHNFRPPQALNGRPVYLVS